MELSLTYSTEVLQRPDGINDWVRTDSNFLYIQR